MRCEVCFTELANVGYWPQRDGKKVRWALTYLCKACPKDSMGICKMVRVEERGAA